MSGQITNNNFTATQLDEWSRAVRTGMEQFGRRVPPPAPTNLREKLAMQLVEAEVRPMLEQYLRFTMTNKLRDRLQDKLNNLGALLPAYTPQMQVEMTYARDTIVVYIEEWRKDQRSKITFEVVGHKEQKDPDFEMLQTMSGPVFVRRPYR
jgi:hypothetical protein